MLKRISLATLVLFASTAAFAQLADFTAEVREGCFPLTVEFKDASTGTVSDWLWNFGNNKTSTLSNPSTIYTEPGVYDVTLTVTNGGGAPSTRIKAGFIIVHDYPDVNFTVDNTSGCAPLDVKFRDQTSTSSGNITSWFWVFGDGGTSSQANPTYTYKSPGTRAVSLKVRNQFGCEKLKTISSPIEVLGPTVKFTPNKPAICTLPATFSFTNQSTGNTPTYKWDFGDGTSSNAESPSHVYTQAGTYNVTLTATDAQGCQQTFASSVTAGGESGLTIKAVDKVCNGTGIEFDYESTDAAVSVLWEFGDGTTSEVNDPPAKVYSQPGTYNVKLTALLLNHTCESVAFKKVVVAKPAIPSFTSASTCEYELTLTSTSTNTSRVEWYIEDEPMMTSTKVVSPLKVPGLQFIRLLAFDEAGCSVELEKEVYVPANPIAAFTPDKLQSCFNEPILSGCAPFTVNFKDETKSNDGPISLKWEFGEGHSSTTTKDTLVTYSTKGLYQVTLTATNKQNGCKGVATQFVVVADQAPIADFGIDKTIACSGEDVSFTNKSTGADYFCWDFGDNIIETGENVVHRYSRPGVYTVKLVAKNAGCTSQKIMTNVITIKKPLVNFEWTKSCSDPHKVTLVNKSKDYDELRWVFGDGKTSDSVDVLKHRYQNEGVYRLSLIGKNLAENCVVEAYSTVVIQDLKANFGVNTEKPCKGAPLIFTDKSSAATKWEWIIAGKEFDTPNPSLKLREAGTYNASLKVTDSDGCIKSASKQIEVLDMEGDFSFIATSTCDDFLVNFVNQSTGTPAPDSWLWNFGDGQTSAQKNPSHTYADLGKYNVTLTVTNSDGHSCEFKKDNAIVFENPIPGFETAKSEFCPGEVVQVANTTKNAILYEWDYGDGRRADFTSPAITYPNTGSYDISLFATDAFGCERKLVKNELVIIEKPTADFDVETASGSCPPFTAVFHDNSESNIKGWQWDFGDGQQSQLEDPANVYHKPGRFDVKLTVTDKNGCTDSKTINQFVSVGGPYGNFVFDEITQCTNKNITFRANITNTAVLRWDFGDGNVQDGSKNEITHTYTSAGEFTPTLLLIDANGCENLAEGSTVLQVRDTTGFSISVSPDCIRTSEKFTLKGSSKNENDITNWTWIIDGVESGNGQTIESILDAPGRHIVTGYVTNKFNCISNLTETVRVQGPITMIPNVITPNGDAVNQSFRMTGLENSTWNIDIVNRWGTTVYSKNGYTGDWDGEDQPAGVYYYIIRNAVCEDKDYRGYVSIVR